MYWSGLEVRSDYISVGPGIAWAFATASGQQAAYSNDSELYAWAVRPGDVSAVPEVNTYAMLLAGLGLVHVAARRRRTYLLVV